MLPFLKKERSPGLIIEQRKPDDDKQEENQGLIAAANDLIQAVHNKDAKGVAEAFQNAFELLESMPHEEASHEDQE